MTISALTNNGTLNTSATNLNTEIEQIEADTQEANAAVGAPETAAAEDEVAVSEEGSALNDELTQALQDNLGNIFAAESSTALLGTLNGSGSNTNALLTSATFAQANTAGLLQAAEAGDQSGIQNLGAQAQQQNTGALLNTLA